jgi:hypothetical protein
MATTPATRHFVIDLNLIMIAPSPAMVRR